MTWDNYFMAAADLASTRSKDPSTKVGAVIVKDKTIISMGYNGFPRNCDDSESLYKDRDSKLKYVVHAEENALLNCCRNGSTSTIGTSIFISSQFPCSRCSKSLIQAGINRIVYKINCGNKDKWLDDFEISKYLLAQANVTLEELKV